MISVIMPVYNAESFLKESVDSILNQTEEDLELIIINDGSTDKSEEIIHSYTDPRIICIKQENQGEASARNTGLEHAKGDFIAFQDADDISLPVRLEVLKRQFTSQNIGFTHSDFLLINENKEPISYWQSRSIEKWNIVRFFLKIGTPYNNPGMMIRREAICPLSYDTSLKIGTDTDMVFKIARNWDSVHVPLPLVLYRLHSNNISKGSDYSTYYAHVQKFLTECSIEELVAELDWANGDLVSNNAKATAIVSLFLCRRGMTLDYQSWIEKAISLSKSKETEIFVSGIGKLASGDYHGSLELLETLGVNDPIAENYIGEAYAYLGNTTEAFSHFLRSIGLKPDYMEPIENLKGFGGLKYLNLIDRSWLKFNRG